MKSKEKVIQFLSALSDHDYKKAFECCTKTWQQGNSKNKLKEIIPIKINSFEIIDMNTSLELNHKVCCKINYSNKDRTIIINCIKEEAPHRPSDKGEWGCNPISAIKHLF